MIKVTHKKNIYTDLLIFVFMFYRRKIILALIQLFGGEIEKIRFQKLLFLLSRLESDPTYDFIPYKYGCYSYSANADIKAMVNRGVLAETEKTFRKTDSKNYLNELKVFDLASLKEIEKLYGGMTNSSLVKHTYTNYPYYSVNSLIVKDILTIEQIDSAKNQIVKTDNDIILYTIGYEGVSLEAYLNKLIKNDVKLLVDVRKNALSQKYGFSKSSLAKFCESVGISYIHIPEVGIISEKRQELNTQSDYDQLFLDYKQTTIQSTSNYQKNILDLLVKYKRIALTCFEANICQCHRKPLSEAISNLKDFKYELKHI